MNAFTPGPWTLCDGLVEGTGGLIIAGVVLSRTRLADLRLIVAAPELLAACQALKRAYDNGEDNDSYMDWEDLDAAYQLALEAIAKATGA